MNQTYKWLFENYAEDLQGEFKEYEEQVIDQLAQAIPLTDHQRIKLVDSFADARFRCGVESFALGVQFGLRLTMDYWGELPESTAF
ncbi:MAG: hypothetical protein HDT14_13570 [Oscillibacter sp.]|nr:hypothetical protein [Oscillibacter sp.]